MPNLTVDPQIDPLISNDHISVNPFPHNLSKSILIGILIFVLLSLTAYGAYWYGQSVMTNKIVPSTSSFNNAPNPKPVLAPVDETASWKTYTNKLWGFSLKYPANLFGECGTRHDEVGLRLFSVPLECPVGPNDAIPKITVRGLKKSDYKASGYKVEKVEDIEINGVVAVRERLIYDEQTSALLGSKNGIEVMISRNTTIIVFNTFIETEGDQKEFDQILPTFKFL